MYDILQLQLSPLTTSAILSSNNIQNGYIWVPAYAGCRGRWLLKECDTSDLQGKRRERWRSYPHGLSVWSTEAALVYQLRQKK